MKVFFSLCVFSFCCNAALCDDIVLSSGKVLKDAIVSEKGADFIRVNHSEGIGKVPYSELTREMQEKYNMTPEEVQGRIDDQQKREEESNRIIRDSLSESEKLPRYLKSSDMLKMMRSVTDVTPLEAEYAALVWNSSEAQRVGMSEQRKEFIEKAMLIEPRVRELRAFREKAEISRAKESRKLQGELASANKMIEQLKYRVSDIKGDLAQLEQKKETPRTVYVETPVYIQQPRPPIIINRPVCQPDPPIRVIGSGGFARPIRAEVITPSVIRPAGSPAARR